MYTIRQSQHFLRKAHKLIGKNARLDTAISKTIHALTNDPFLPSLRTHSVIARLDGERAMSSFVTNDLRIIWRFSEERIHIINLIDIGGHSGSGKVYR